MTCPEPPRVINSRQILSYAEGEKPRLNDYVTYQCYYRYYLDGAATLICREDGNWAPEPPECKSLGDAVASATTDATTMLEPGCPAPPTLANTRVIKYYDGIARPGDVAEFHCLEGFEPTASTGRSVCTPNRRWAVDPNFACVEAGTGSVVIQDMMNGNAMGIADASTMPSQRYCPAPLEIDNARMSVFYLGRARPGDVVEYKCFDGFLLEGQPRMTCREDYTWSESPRCAESQTAAPAGCSAAPDVENGYVASTNSMGDYFAAGDYVIFSCHSGYLLIGNRNVYCLTSGRWTTKPTCIPEPSAPTPPFVTTRTTPAPPVVVTSSNQRATARIIPIATAAPAGPAASTICSDLQSPAYAIRELTSYWMAARPGDFVRFRCLPGYTLSGNNRVVCQENGEWSVKPTCVPVEGTTQYNAVSGDVYCPAPPTVPNAGQMIFFTGRARPGDYVDYNCMPGFQLLGTMRITCKSDGTWSDIPRCNQDFTTASTPRPVFCPAAPTVDNAAQMSHLEGAAKPGDSIDYACRPGYELGGVSRITCQSNGQWSPAPTCSLNPNCRSPPPIENGFYLPTSRNGDKYIPGDSAMISCLDGFEMVEGSNVIYCMANGEWSAAPTCRVKLAPPACTRLPTVDNAFEVSATFDRTANAGDYVKYQCQSSFLMVGNDTVVCQADGSWTLLPKCVKACPEPPNIPNGFFKGASYNGRPPLPGDSVLVECASNYTLSGGVNYMLCRSDNTWTPAPRCECKFFLFIT